MKLLQSVQLIDSSHLRSIIDYRKPKGLFLCYEENWWVAVDNSTSDAWTEAFLDGFEAIQWLFRVGE